MLPVPNTHIFFTNVKNHSCLSMKGDSKIFFLFLFIYPFFPEIQGVHSVCNSPAVPASRRVWISGVLHRSQRPIIFLLHCVHGPVYPNISFCIMLDNKQSRSMSVYSCRPNGVHPSLTRKFGVPPHCRQHRKSSLSHKVFYQAVSKVIAIMGLPWFYNQIYLHICSHKEAVFSKDEQYQFFFVVINERKRERVT